MAPPMALSRYLASRFFKTFLGIIALTALLFFIAQLVELPRRAEGNYEVQLAELLLMSLYQIPGLVEQTLVFSVLYGSMWTFLSLSRREELTAIMAAGVSNWQILRIPLLIAALTGLLAMTALNPFAAFCNARFHQLEAELQLRSAPQDKAPGNSRGFWMRQMSEEGPFLIYALSSRDNNQRLDNVVFLRYRADSDMSLWIRADEAQKHPMGWVLRNALVYGKNDKTTSWKRYSVKTRLSSELSTTISLRPASVSFWNLPGFIALMELTGVSSAHYQLKYQSLLARPLLLCSMVLIAAFFSMRLFRIDNIIWLVLGGLITGFLLYFANIWIYQLGRLETIQVVLAAWLPALAATLIGAITLFIRGN